MSKYTRKGKELVDALDHKPTDVASKGAVMCGGKNCQGRKVGKRIIPNSGNAFEWITERSVGHIVIRRANGEVLGHLCQECYDKHLYAMGKGRFSGIVNGDEMMTPEAVNLYDPANDVEMQRRLSGKKTESLPPSFKHHLAALDELADRYASEQDNDRS